MFEKVNPAHQDKIADRWEQLTGKKATRLERQTMADIFVMGIEPPTKYGDIHIVLDKDGKVYEDDGHFITKIGEWKKLPSHGRLVDADRLPVSTRIYHHTNGVEIETLELKYVNLKHLQNAPTVLEAST